MPTQSNIEWTDATYNHWLGCTKVSPACAHCYAESWAKRSGLVAWGAGEDRRRTQTPQERAIRRLDAAAARGRFVECHVCGRREVRKWDPTIPPGGLAYCSNPDCLSLPESESDPVRPRVFSASLSDWLDDEVPLEWLWKLIDLIRTTPHLDWLLLTKRPENFRTRLEALLEMIPRTGLTVDDAYNLTRIQLMLHGWDSSSYIAPEIGTQNYWIGTTVEDQKHAELRIPHLLSIPARIRFLSCEPLLGPLNLAQAVGCVGRCSHENCTPLEIHWVIAGGESGGQARPSHPAWFRSLRDQCAAHDIPFLFKQWGEWVSVSEVEGPGRIHTFPDDSCVRRVGKKKAGRTLDGRIHHAFPGP